MFYARAGGAAAVPPYAADPSNKKLWELGHKKHQKAMVQVLEEPNAIDQSMPKAFGDKSLKSGRERSRIQNEENWHRHVGSENRKLMGALHEIAATQCTTLKRIRSEPGILPPLSVGNNMIMDRRRKQTAIEVENERIVKRLLSIKTTFNRKKEQKEYNRHQIAVQDMAKVQPPSGPPPRIKLIGRPRPPAIDHRKKLGQLPPLEEGSEPEDESGTFIPAASRSQPNASSPLVRASSDSNRPLSHSRSVPSLIGASNRSPQKRAISAEAHEATASRSSPPARDADARMARPNGRDEAPKSGSLDMDDAFAVDPSTVALENDDLPGSPDSSVGVASPKGLKQVEQWANNDLPGSPESGASPDESGRGLPDRTPRLQASTANTQEGGSGVDSIGYPTMVQSPSKADRQDSTSGVDSIARVQASLQAIPTIMLSPSASASAWMFSSSAPVAAAASAAANPLSPSAADLEAEADDTVADNWEAPGPRGDTAGSIARCSGSSWRSNRDRGGTAGSRQSNQSWNGRALQIQSPGACSVNEEIGEQLGFELVQGIPEFQNQTSTKSEFNRGMYTTKDTLTTNKSWATGVHTVASPGASMGFSDENSLDAMAERVAASGFNQ